MPELKQCKHRGPALLTRKENGEAVTIYRCAKRRSCTLADHGFVNADGPLPVCETCDQFVAGPPFVQLSVPRQTAPAEGVGAEVAKILKLLGIVTGGCQGCQDMIDKMNRWGVAGCAENRETILNRLREQAARLSWWNTRKAEALAVASGLAREVSWLDPAPGILDKAVGIVSEREKPRDMSGEPRHMLYHIWPNRANDAWRWNVEQLLQRIDQFGGVRSVGVVTDESTDTLETVQSAFAGVRIDNWIHRPNDPKIREGATFVPLMNTLPRDSGVTWYGHAKGVSHDQAKTTRQWADAMYRLTLDEWTSVLESLRSHPITGAFRRRDDFKNLPKHHQWHYSGTFYWFRNADVFTRDGWNDLNLDKFFAVEAWPARIFALNESGCLFGDDAGNLYEAKEWERWIPKLSERRLTNGSSVSP